MKTEFTNCQLYTSLRSPFARRVRLAFLENQIEYEEKMVDVLTPNQEVMAFNPLGRVPTVILKTGEVMFESHLILQAFYTSQKSSFFPEKNRLELFRWMALATGMMDKSIEYFFESQRPSSQRDPDWLAEISITVQNSLNVLESRLSSQEFLVGQQVSQADLDMGAALDYLSLRISGDWKNEFLHTQKYLENLHQRPSFQKTAPPPAK